MGGKIKKVLNNIFSNKIVISVLFWIFAILPLVISDVVLRYVLNPISLQNRYVFVPILFNLFWIFLIIYICNFILPEKIGRIVYVIFTIIFGLWFFANFISFKMFSRFLWIKTIFLVSEAKDYASAVIKYIDIKVILVGIIYIGSITLTCILWRKRNIEEKILRFFPIIIAIVGILGVNSYMNMATFHDKLNGAWEVWDKPTLVYEKFTDANKSLNIAGLYQYTFKSICKMFSNNNKVLPAKEAMADEFFETKRQQVEENEMTGILKDKNVMFVLMESIDSWMINDKYMPTVKYMMENGINFTNHYMPNVGVGYTFNAEFAANSGLYCPSTETSASIFSGNSFPYSLANIANNKGYVSNSFHFNVGSFYNRAVLHRQFGYKDYKSFMKYLSLEKCVQDSEAVKSDKIYGMMTENEKFLDFIITYSAHLPYEEENNKLKGAMANYPELIDESLDLETRNALLLAHDTDEFFRILLERLESDGLLENTVIIAFTDHYTYGISDPNKVLALRGEDENGILEKVPFFIYSPGLEHREIKKVTSAIDILPTIINMLGLDNDGYYLGNDAFDDNYKGLVYFPNGDWYDGDIYYSAEGTLDEKNIDHIKEMNTYIAKLVSINDYVVLTDYFSRLNIK